jgi:hypothetical protein
MNENMANYRIHANGISQNPNFFKNRKSSVIQNSIYDALKTGKIGKNKLLISWIRFILLYKIKYRFVNKLILKSIKPIS